MLASTLELLEPRGHHNTTTNTMGRAMGAQDEVIQVDAFGISQGQTFDTAPPLESVLGYQALRLELIASI